MFLRLSADLYNCFFFLFCLEGISEGESHKNLVMIRQDFGVINKI